MNKMTEEAKCELCVYRTDAPIEDRYICDLGVYNGDGCVMFGSMAEYRKIYMGKLSSLEEPTPYLAAKVFSKFPLKTEENPSYQGWLRKWGHLMEK